MGGDVFGLELDGLVEVGDGQDVGALPGEGGEAIGLAFAEGRGEVEGRWLAEVTCGAGWVRLGQGSVEIAIVAVDAR